MRQIYNFLKKQILLLLPVVVLFSCSSDPEVPEPEIYAPGSREELLKWKAEDFNHIAFYSPIDTFSDFKGLVPFVEIYYKDTSPVEVAWKINSVSYSTIETRKVWNEQHQIWHTVHKPAGAERVQIGDIIQVNAKLNGKSYSTEAEIKEQKVITDLFAVTWGMTKEMVKEREEQRRKMISGSMRIYETGPNNVILDATSSFSSFSKDFTQYDFTNGQLTYVAEYIPIENNNRALLLNAIDLRARKLGLQDVIVADQHWNLRKEYKWSNDKLNFEVTFTDSAAGQCLGIVYTKK